MGDQNRHGKRRLEETSEPGQGDDSRQMRPPSTPQGASTKQLHGYSAPIHQPPAQNPYGQQSSYGSTEQNLIGSQFGSLRSCPSHVSPGNPFLTAHQTHDRLHELGTVQAIKILQGLGLYTDLAWDHDVEDAGGRPAFPHPDSNPHGSLATNNPRLEDRGAEIPYTKADLWWLRMSVASGLDLGAEQVAARMNRTFEDLDEYAQRSRIYWAPWEDRKLEALNKGERGLLDIVDEFIDDLEGPRRSYEIIARAKLLACLGHVRGLLNPEYAIRPGPHDSHSGIQGNDHVMPQVEREICGQLMSAIERKVWSQARTENLNVLATAIDEMRSRKQMPVHGDKAAQTSSIPGHEPRDEDESEDEARYDAVNSTKRRRQYFRWTDKHTDALGRELARGNDCPAVARKGFYGLAYSNIRARARTLGLMWKSSHDRKLCLMNLRPDHNTDWDAIGQTFERHRKGELVQIRWEFLQTQEGRLEDEHSEADVDEEATESDHFIG